MESSHAFDSKGRLQIRQTVGRTGEHFEYDSLSQPALTGFDMDGSGGLQVNSTDRLNQKETSYALINSSWWRIEKAYVFDDGAGTGTLVNETRTRLTGLGTVDGSGTLVAHVLSIDANNNQSESKTWASPSAGQVTTRTYASAFYSNYAEKIIVNGVVYQESSASGVATTYTYDSLGRVQKSVSTAGAETRYEYEYGKMRLLRVKVPDVDNPASFITSKELGEYDAVGRLRKETDALGKSTYYHYNNRGQVTHLWGDAPYPTKNVYDTYGQLWKKLTYRNPGVNFAQSPGSWPSLGADPWFWPADSVGDALTYEYYPKSGLLYRSIDAQGRYTEYRYSETGDLYQRVWNRGVTTTYGYHAKTGELTSVSYSDSTPGLGYTYNRRGAVSSVTQGSNTWTFGYDSGDFQIDTVSLPVGLYGASAVFRYKYEATNRRFNGYEVPDAVGGNVPVAYGYEISTGRLDIISSMGGDFDYGYLAGSDRIETIHRQDPPSGLQFYWKQEFLTPHFLLGAVESRVGGVSGPVLARHAYRYNNRSQRKDVVQTGSLFSRYGSASGLATRYGYDDRDQLTSAVTRLTTNPDDTGSASLPARSYGYAFDAIGNRTTASVDSNSFSYTANSLNQYGSRTTPGVFPVAGLVTNSSTVQIDGTTSGVWRSGDWANDYYHKDIGKNSGGGQWQNVTVSVNGSPATFAELTRPTAESFTYDLDGNLTADGAYEYVFDAENRLTEIRTKPLDVH